MDPTQEAICRRILLELYSGGFELRQLDTLTSAVFIADFTDKRDSVIVKLPVGNEQEVLREQRLMDALDAIGISVPPVLYTQENRPVGDQVYTITRCIHGHNTSEIIRADDPTTEQVFTRLGRLTAELAAIPLSALPDAMAPDRVQADELDWWEDHQQFITRHRRTTDVLQVVYHAARGIMLNPPTYFGHRDGVQFATDGKGLYLVDVGSAGATWPDADFARLLYTGIAWHDGQNYRVWREAAQHAYLEGRAPSDADVERIIIFMLYYAMRDAAAFANTPRANRVPRQFDIADYILKESRGWFGR